MTQVIHPDVKLRDGLSGAGQEPDQLLALPSGAHAVIRNYVGPEELDLLAYGVRIFDPDTVLEACTPHAHESIGCLGGEVSYEGWCGVHNACDYRGSILCGLTFEVRRDRRQDARPGLVKMYAYHQPGPGGLPLGLASTEGLGLTGQCTGYTLRW